MIHSVGNPYWRFSAVVVLLFLVFVPLHGVMTVHAQALPAFPRIYYGTATVEGVPLEDGALITARIGGRIFGPVSVKNGSFYNLAIQADASSNKDVITFYLQGVEPAGQQRIYRYVNYPILP